MGLENKKENFGEWFNEVIEAAGIVDKRYPVKGMPIWMPYGYAVHENIINILEKSWNACGHKKVLFPTLIPKSLFKKESEHIKGFEGEVYWVTKGGNNALDEELLLRPTSEVPIYYMFSLWIRSHNELPFKIYQTCTVFRYETKATKPLIRAREIPWNEAHAVHKSWDDAEKQINREVIPAYNNLIKGLGMSSLILKRPEWDKFPGAEYTLAWDLVMPDGKILQVATAHNLGQKFAKAFGIKFLDENKENCIANQTCYGVSSRLTAALLSAHGDDSGLVLPFAVAPTQIVIIPILSKEVGKDVEKKCMELKARLEKEFRVEIDSSDKRPGEKYYFWELKGVPLRIEIGPRDMEKNQVVLVRRDTKEKSFVNEKELPEKIKSVEKDMLATMQKNAEKHLTSHLNEAKDRAELKKLLKEKGGFVKVNFCSTDQEGRACADKLNEQTGCEVRGTSFEHPEKSDGSCIICGKKAKEFVYIAKAY